MQVFAGGGWGLLGGAMEAMGECNLQQRFEHESPDHGSSVLTTNAPCCHFVVNAPNIFHMKTAPGADIFILSKANETVAIVKTTCTLATSGVAVWRLFLDYTSGALVSSGTLFPQKCFLNIHVSEEHVKQIKLPF